MPAPPNQFAHYYCNYYYYNSETALPPQKLCGIAVNIRVYRSEWCMRFHHWSAMFVQQGLSKTKQ